MTEQYYDYLEELFEKKIADKKLKSILFDILKDGMKEKNQNPEETQLQIAGEQVLVYLRLRSEEDLGTLQRINDVKVYDAVAELIDARNYATKTQDGKEGVSMAFEDDRKKWQNKFHYKNL